MTWADISAAFTNVGDIVTQAVTTIGGNVVLLTFLCVGLVASGLRLFKKAKKAVK